MRLAAATAGLVSTAVLLSGCDNAAEPKPGKGDPIRRAAYRSFAARDLLRTCADADGPVAAEERRFEQLRQFAGLKGAGDSLWLGENDWNAVSRLSHRVCGLGVDGLRDATAGFGRSLDELAAAIAEHRE